MLKDEHESDLHGEELSYIDEAQDLRQDMQNSYPSNVISLKKNVHFMEDFTRVCRVPGIRSTC